YLLCSFCSSCELRDLHSFPTRRSSDLMAKYHASLEPVEAMYERELARQTELAEIRQELYERGTLSASDVQQGRRALVKAQKDVRSEEHTSELQSRGHLVCRLLLEKKKM